MVRHAAWQLLTIRTPADFPITSMLLDAVQAIILFSLFSSFPAIVGVETSA